MSCLGLLQWAPIISGGLQRRGKTADDRNWCCSWLRQFVLLSAFNGFARSGLPFYQLQQLGPFDDLRHPMPCPRMHGVTAATLCCIAGVSDKANRRLHCGHIKYTHVALYRLRHSTAVKTLRSTKPIDHANNMTRHNRPVYGFPASVSAHK